MSLMQTKPTHRDLSLDLLKGIAIIMVIFFHNIQLNPDGFLDNLFMLAANAAVPCFFLVSGALFFSRPFHLKKHISRMIRFYFVYTAWRILYLFFYVSHGAPLDGSLRTLASYLFFFQTIPGVETSHFWFMDAMLTVMLAAPFFHICWKEHRQLIPYLMGILFLFNQLLTAGNLFFAVVCPLIGKPALDISAFAEINPFSFRHSNYMFYYLLGAVLYEQKTADHTPQVLRSRFFAPLLILIGLGGLVMIKYLESGTFLWQGLHVTSGYYRISTMLLSCGAFLLIQRSPIQTNKLPAWFARTIGTSTMGIFYLHIPLIFLLRPSLFAKLSSCNGWLLNLAESLFIAFLAYGITFLGKKIPLFRIIFQG